MRLMRSVHGDNLTENTEAAVSNFGIREYILTVCVISVLRWPTSDVISRPNSD